MDLLNTPVGQRNTVLANAPPEARQHPTVHLPYTCTIVRTTSTESTRQTTHALLSCGLRSAVWLWDTQTLCTYCPLDQRLTDFPAWVRLCSTHRAHSGGSTSASTMTDSTVPGSSGAPGTLPSAPLGGGRFIATRSSDMTSRSGASRRVYLRNERSGVSPLRRLGTSSGGDRGKADRWAAHRSK
jgi:hypothetical protein